MSFYLIAGVAALGGLLFGYDTGVVSGALLFIRDAMSLSATMQGIVVAIVLAGAVIGSAAAGSLSDRFGRRRVILVAGLLFIAGALFSAATEGLTLLLCGRFLLGLGALPGVILTIGMIILPESPRWLAGHGRLQDAGLVLRRLRGEADVSEKLNALRTDIARQGRQLAGWTELFSPRMRRPLVIGIGLAMVQQITGINTVKNGDPTGQGHNGERTTDGGDRCTWRHGTLA